jgi:hypothetical protein
MKVPPLLSDDVLGQNIPLYVAIILCIFAAQTIILILMGQSFLPRSRLRLWWGDIHSPENSKHMTDPYTATHIVHGLVGFYACLLCFSTLPLVAVIYYYLITLATAALWEIVENTPCVIEVLYYLNRAYDWGLSVCLSVKHFLCTICVQVVFKLCLN